MNIYQRSYCLTSLLILGAVSSSLQAAELTIPYADGSSSITITREKISLASIYALETTNHVSLSTVCKEFYETFQRSVGEYGSYNYPIFFQNEKLFIGSSISKDKSKGPVPPSTNSNILCQMLSGKQPMRLLLCTTSTMTILEEDGEFFIDNNIGTAVTTALFARIADPRQASSAIFTEAICSLIKAAMILNPSAPLNQLTIKILVPPITQDRTHAYFHSKILHNEFARPLIEYIEPKYINDPSLSWLQGAIADYTEKGSAPMGTRWEKSPTNPLPPDKKPVSNPHTNRWLPPFLGAGGIASALYLFTQNKLFTRYGAIPGTLMIAAGAAYGYSRKKA